ncbi:hypothetical protein SARC_01407 [Sphaeroforma arctica JP610]|uniref:Uncharacterized protein n=1 Tax=Sphaeroforma arctica JP610 TaxID=667725 RepID=A0A0L0GC27_9EUKA|nr:hypothetical protein SARC_01407 [Sphaeroforma arctica JP610]KNC86451.1 hypothetical protein SARC_01407 [Sphaeroforma arctica JP610]|eukprot:XP_014160353.1 hypothetical protein SARC_01407 [Sphaeroforma arctica JP610]
MLKQPVAEQNLSSSSVGSEYRAEGNIETEVQATAGRNVYDEDDDIDSVLAELAATPTTNVPQARVNGTSPLVGQSRMGYRISSAAKGKVHANPACGSLKNKQVLGVVITETTDLCKKCNLITPDVQMLPVGSEDNAYVNEAFNVESPNVPTQVPVVDLTREPTATVTTTVQSRTGYRIAGATKGKVHIAMTCGSIKNKSLDEVAVTGTTDLCKKCNK